MPAKITINPLPTAALPTTATPAATSFIARILEFTISLGNDPETNQPRIFDNGQNTVTLSGHRASVRVQNSGTPKGSNAQVDIFGLTPSMMNQLSTLGLVFNLVPQNIITIKAGDARGGVATVFVGNSLVAVPNFGSAPDVAMHFECQAGLSPAVNAVAPSSYPEASDVGTIMAQLAKVMGLGFENNGVDVTLPPGYYPGSAGDQYKKVARDAGIVADILPGASGAQVLAIWPRGGSRNLVAPLVAPPPDGGMIGYPSYTQQGILVKTIYNPQIGFGGQIEVKSSLPRATGTWNVIKLDHSLDSMIPKGLWESSMWCFNPKYPQPIPQG